MKYTNLGNTGLQVSRICLGCMSYGDPAWRPWILGEEASQPFFRRAVEAGINFFDTADQYSVGVSEEVTGRALKKYANLEECVVATKVFNPMGEGPNMRGLSRKHIQQGCEASLRRLGLETIDLYIVHRYDARTPIEEMLAALDLLVRQGKVRYLGASSMEAWRFGQCLSASERNGWAKFVSMQNHYNLVYREEEREMLPLCRDQGIGVTPWSPLARGMLARAQPSPQAGGATERAETDDIAVRLYDHPGDAAVVSALAEVARERGVQPAQVALAWLLAQPGVTAPIVGATKLPHLEAALDAVDLELTPAEIDRLAAPYQPHAVRWS